MATVPAIENKDVKIPGVRFYAVTADDGDDFIPSGINAQAAICNYAQAPGTGNPCSADVSNGVVTINCTGASGANFFVIVIGQD